MAKAKHTPGARIGLLTYLLGLYIKTPKLKHPYPKSLFKNWVYKPIQRYSGSRILHYLFGERHFVTQKSNLLAELNGEMCALYQSHFNNKPKPTSKEYIAFFKAKAAVIQKLYYKNEMKTRQYLEFASQQGNQLTMRRSAGFRQLLETLFEKTLKEAAHHAGKPATKLPKLTNSPNMQLEQLKQALFLKTTLAMRRYTQSRLGIFSLLFRNNKLTKARIGIMKNVYDVLHNKIKNIKAENVYHTLQDIQKTLQNALDQQLALDKMHNKEHSPAGMKKRTSDAEQLLRDGIGFIADNKKRFVYFDPKMRFQSTAAILYNAWGRMKQPPKGVMTNYKDDNGTVFHNRMTNQTLLKIMGYVAGDRFETPKYIPSPEVLFGKNNYIQNIVQMTGAENLAKQAFEAVEKIDPKGSPAQNSDAQDNHSAPQL